MTKLDYRPSALILAPFEANILENLQINLNITYESWVETRVIHDQERLKKKLSNNETTILVIESDFVFEEILDNVPSLKFIAICRNATNHVDLDSATKNGVVVVNSPGRNSTAVAEHTLGLMLSLSRNIPQGHNYIVDGEWTNPVEAYISLRGIELAGKTLGIIGLGAIGRRVAKIGTSLGMTSIAYDPYIDQNSTGIPLMTLKNLLKKSDFISIHSPLTAESRGLLGETELAFMKPTAYLLNLSESAIVDQHALFLVLKENRIAGAALDVFETHPIIPNHPLLELDNVIFTPHLGGATYETIRRHSEIVANNLSEFLDGRCPSNIVNPGVWNPHE